VTARRELDALARRAAATPGLIPLAGGLPADRQFPRAALAASFLRVLDARDGAALQYGWPEGQGGLRARIAARLGARVGAAVSADDVIVTNGAQQAIAIAAASLARPGDAIGVEPASYPAALELFRVRGLRLVPLGEARVSYVMSTLGNPTGRALDAPGRRAAARGRWIIDDDAYGELAFEGRTAPLWQGRRGRVVHVGTFSKTLCPGLRVGWLVVPEALRARALRLKHGDDLQANSLAQAVVDDTLAHIDFDARLAVLRRYYRSRAARLARAIRRALPAWSFAFPEGGFSLWLEADGRVDDARLLRAAVDEGVSFDPGSTFEGLRDQGPTRLRVCYSAAAPESFDDAAARLARAWRRVHGAARPFRARRAAPHLSS
jgi:2-aminoadipate transaminase